MIVPKQLRPNTYVLYDRSRIHSALQKLGKECKRFDICSYWAGTGTDSISLISLRPGSRIIVGGIREETRALAIAHAVDKYKSRVRYLEGCHVKLFIFYGRKPSVILGSMNLGKGMPYEMAVELHGIPAEECCMHFNNLWSISTTVKPDELSAAVAKLSSSVFEPVNSPT